MDTSTSREECMNMPLYDLNYFYSDYIEEIGERIKARKSSEKR